MGIFWQLGNSLADIQSRSGLMYIQVNNHNIIVIVIIIFVVIVVIIM